MLARTEQIRVLTGGHELRHLRLAHDELRAILDLPVVIRPAVGQGVTRVIGPLDDLDQFFLDEIENTHLADLVCGESADSRTDRGLCARPKESE